MFMEEQILSKYQQHCENNSIIMQQPSVIEVKRKYAYLLMVVICFQISIFNSAFFGRCC